VGSVTLWAEPENNGQVLHDAIVGAQHSVDIPIWEIGGPQIMKALIAAKKNGVAIRIMFNGNFGCGPDKNSFRFDQAYSVIDTLTAADGDGQLAFHWASNNFSITHQKTVIIDAFRDGQRLPPQDLPETAKVLVLTLNICPYAWMVSDTGERAPMPWVFWGPEQPDIGFPIRDFGAVVTKPELVVLAATVFETDFNIAPPDFVIDLKNMQNGLVWSNGTTGITPNLPGEYPHGENNYPGFNADALGKMPTAANQGNSLKACTEVINAAQKTLIIYNEEMADTNLVDAIAARAQANVDVRVILTGNVRDSKKDGESYAYWRNYNTLAKAGVSIRLYPAEGQWMYIHAKVLLADAGTSDAIAFMGSENIGGNSLYFNRELGLILQGEDDTRLFIETFEKDWQQTGLVDWPSDGTALTPTPVSETGVPRFQSIPANYTPILAGPVAPRDA